MTIRTKINIVLFASLVTCAAGLSGTLLWFEKARLEHASLQRTELIAEALSKTAVEALLDRDELMVISHAKLLLREHPYLLAVELHSPDGADVGVGERPIPESEQPLTVSRTVKLPAGSRPKGGDARIDFDLIFSGKRLEADVGDALAAAAGRAAEVTALVALAAFVASLLISRALVRPLAALSDAIERIGEGRFGIRIDGQGSDELGRIAGKVNHMSQRLQELDKIKREFVASVTHELKSPLGAIESYVRMLRENNSLSERQQTHLRRIEDSAGRLGQFITNLLEEAKIERGQMGYDPRDSDVGELVKEASLLFRPRFLEAGVTLVTWREPDLPTAWVDPERIQQVVINLISNALKFTPKGGKVTLSVRRKDKHELEIQVEDTGAGVRPEDHERVFLPFERAPTAIRTPGAGLGLSICKAIVEQHGGKIDFESTPGEGSRFWFTVPLQPPSPV
jgi:signal transduction histidine kinase